MTQDIDLSKYKKLDGIQHVLARPNTYLGSFEFKNEQQLEEYDPSLDRPIYRRYDAILCSSLITLFNELIDNSADERVRCINENRDYIVNQICIRVNPHTGKIACWDNGGMPIVKHPEYDEWIPEMLLGSLRSGSNFDDTVRKDVSGLNGVGSSLVNVMSHTFKVVTALNGQQFEMTWTKNMREKTDAKITKTKPSNHFTYIEAHLEMPRWSDINGPLTCIPNDIVKKWLSRCIEVAVMGCDIDPKRALEVKWELEDEHGNVCQTYKFKFSHLWEYKDLWQGTEEFRGDENENYAFEVGPSRFAAFESFALVNSIRCDYGKHMDFIANVIADYVKDYIKSKHGYDIKRKQDIFKHMSIISMWKIPAPDFESQTKDYLATPTEKFGFPIIISDKLKKYLCKTQLVQDIVDEQRAKKLLEDDKAKKEEQKRINKALEVKTKQFHVNKLVDASKKTDRDDCELFIVEGDSASQGLRQFRDAFTQGFYCMRGKSIGNCWYSSESQLIKKPELLGLMQSIGLKFGQRAERQNLRYGRISIMTDADVDGDGIAALISLFFFKHWPELYEQHMIYHVLTPIVIATKYDKRGLVTDTKRFYTQDDFDKAEEDLVKAGYDCQYKKGLAALTMEEFEHCMENPVLEEFKTTYDELDPTNDTWKCFEAWFSNNSDVRKNMMVGVSLED